jgi:hypothetical protein
MQIYHIRSENKFGANTLFGNVGRKVVLLSHRPQYCRADRENAPIK